MLVAAALQPLLSRANSACNKSNKPRDHGAIAQMLAALFVLGRVLSSAESVRRSPRSPPAKPEPAQSHEQLTDMGLISLQDGAVSTGSTHQQRYTPMRAMPEEPKKNRERPQARRGS